MFDVTFAVIAARIVEHRPEIEAPAEHPFIPTKPDAQKQLGGYIEPAA